MPRLLQDLHTHTIFSDGSHAPLDIVLEAIRVNLQGIGLSDHFFTRKIHREETLATWMQQVYPRYIHTGRWLQQNYDSKIKIWLGLEIDTCVQRLGCALVDLPWQDLTDLDYLLIEYAGETSRGGMPLADLAVIRSRWPKPLILAHPDLETMRQTLPQEEVFAIVRGYNVALELPGGSRNRWPWHSLDPTLLEQTWVTMGSDTHRDLNEVGTIARPLAFLEQHGLTHRIADPDSLAGGSV